MDQQNPDAGPNDMPPLMDPETTIVSDFNPDLIPNLIPGALPTDMNLPGQPFLGFPSVVDGSMPDPSSFTLPLMFNGSNPAAAPPAANRIITADEIALYDRQIRLWGMAAQAKIQSANVLLITIRALANEIAKNLVLAGIRSLTLLDDSPVTESDLGAQFLLSSEVETPPLGQNRAEAAQAALRKLNPRVQIFTDTEGVQAKGPAYFANFDVVIATDLLPDELNVINTSTRINGKTFYAAGTHGQYGYIFSDPIQHDYIIKRDLGNVATEVKQETRTRSVVHVETEKQGAKVTESVTKRELYSTWFFARDAATLPPEFTKSKRRLKSVTPILSCFRALWSFQQAQQQSGSGRSIIPTSKDDYRLFTQLTTQKHRALSLPSETLTAHVLRSFLQNLGCEIAPVTAILGGQLAQDVINVLGQTQQPIQNMVVFDGSTMEAPMYALHPEGMTLGAGLLSALTSAMDLSSSSSSMMMPPQGDAVPLFPMNGMSGIPVGMPDIYMLTTEQMAHLAPLNTGFEFMPPAMDPAASLQPSQQQQQQQDQQDQHDTTSGTPS